MVIDRRYIEVISSVSEAFADFVERAGGAELDAPEVCRDGTWRIPR